MKQTAGHGSKYDRKKEEAIIALLSHRNVEEAARAAGISGATLGRWLRQEDFEAEYRKARREAYLQCIARLQQAASAAASTLLKVMLDPATPASARIRAVDSVFTHARYGMEIEDIGVRLSELERAAGLIPDTQEHSREDGKGLDQGIRLMPGKMPARKAD